MTIVYETNALQEVISKLALKGQFLRKDTTHRYLIINHAGEIVNPISKTIFDHRQDLNDDASVWHNIDRSNVADPAFIDVVEHDECLELVITDYGDQIQSRYALEDSAQLKRIAQALKRLAKRLEGGHHD